MACDKTDCILWIDHLQNQNMKQKKNLCFIPIESPSM